jgi:hypothetical protein
MHRVGKEDTITVLKDSLGGKCPGIKIVPTTDVEIKYLKCLFITTIPNEALFVITQYIKVFSLTVFKSQQ